MQATHLLNVTVNYNMHPLAIALGEYMERYYVSRANLVTLSHAGEIGVIAVIDDLSSFQLLYMNNGEVLSYQLGNSQDIQIVIGVYGLWVGGGGSSWTFDNVYTLESGRLLSTSWSWFGANVAGSGIDEYTFNGQNVMADEYNMLVDEIMLRYGIVLDSDAISPWSRDDTALILAMTIIDGRTLVPVRGVFEALGFSVSWDEQARQVTLSRANDTIIITIDSASFIANGISHTLDVPAQIIGGSTMLPIRTVLDFSIYYI